MIAVEDEEELQSAGWLATFADLMSILMCFFVLLLSFSEMDVDKYKQIAGSMSHAFGVQNKVKVKDIPKGTSAIAREFSPGRPNPTAVKTSQQQTADTSKNSLDTRTAPPGLLERDAAHAADTETAKALVRELERRETEQTAIELSRALEKQIREGAIEIEVGHSVVTIRIRERGSFPSGSAQLNGEFVPIMEILKKVLRDVRGAIAVEGHTDDVPISNTLFRSNWELSTQRALSVADALLDEPGIDQSRFMVVGYADSKPRVENDSWENRAQNPRVEIVIRRGTEETVHTELMQLKALNPELFDDLDVSEAVTGSTPIDSTGTS